jgi:spore coat protein U-like protein
MRSFKTLSTVAAGVLLALGGGAQAATDTVNFTVTANVIAFCDVDATDMSFVGFDATVDLPATSTITVNCTNGHPYTLTMDAGNAAGSTIANRTLESGTGDSLTYNLYTDAGHTDIWGDTLATGVGGVGAGVTTDVNHTVYGQLPAVGNEGATTGNYASTITVTVNF